jgi:hypothetical protein
MSLQVRIEASRFLLADGLAKLAAGLVSSAGGAAFGASGGAAALNQDMNNRQLHPSEEAWITSKAKEYAAQNKITEEEAKRQLTQQALKEIDFGWRSILSDGDNENAKKFLASAKDTFENDIGNKQKFFTVEGTQLTRMEMYVPDANADFYKKYAQPGVTRDWKAGFAKESLDVGKQKVGELVDGVKAAGQALKEDPVQASWNFLKGAVGAIPSIPGAIKDGVEDTGKAFGEGAAVAFDKDLTAKMNALYGTDVGGLQKSVLTVRTITTIAAAAGMAKSAAELAETVASKGGKEALEKAAAKGEGTAAKEGAKDGAKTDAPKPNKSEQTEAPPKSTTEPETTPNASEKQPEVKASPADGSTEAPGAACLAPPNCFVAGTLIHTVDGLKPIETFVGGEQVFSRDEFSQEPGLRPVVATVASENQPIHEVVIVDAQGRAETLQTTAEHPFWVTNVAGVADDKGLGVSHAQWVRAASLIPGMALIDLKGQPLTVQSQKEAGWTATVYNIEVHEHHTYHVGEIGVWVHNANCCSIAGETLPTKKTYEVDVNSSTKGTPGYETLNNPPANAHVKLSNGTEFVTNEAGYVEEITFQPTQEKIARDARQTAAGKEGLSSDVGGHVQACRMGGTCDRYNLFPQDGKFNNSTYKALENQWYAALDSGQELGPINVKFTRVDPTSARPDRLVVEFTLNGEKVSRTFLNEAPK